MFGKTDLKELKELILDIENYIKNNTEELVLGKIYMNFLSVFVRVLKIVIEIINENKISTEMNLVRRILKENSYKKGELLKVKQPIFVLKTYATAEEADEERKKDRGSWTSVNVDDVVMFIDAVYDDYYDCVLLQILKGNSIFLLAKEEKTKNLVDFINNKFTKINCEK